MGNRCRQLRVVRLHGPAAQQNPGDEPTRVAERVEMMWPLALDAWAFTGEPVVEQRLPRQIVHVYRRGC
jgi:hypothetical protein